jgi:NAD(P)-dependent dehydrogenase (short-subunit alcohol dehydrogenase family)
VHAVDILDGDSFAAFARVLDGTPIDLLINNASISGNPRQRLHDFDYAAAVRAFEANVFGGAADEPSVRAASPPQVPARGLHTSRR